MVGIEDREREALVAGIKIGRREVMKELASHKYGQIVRVALFSGEQGTAYYDEVDDVIRFCPDGQIGEDIKIKSITLGDIQTISKQYF